MKQIKEKLEKLLIGKSVPVEKIVTTVTTIHPQKDHNYNPNCVDNCNMWFNYIHSHYKK